MSLQKNVLILLGFVLFPLLVSCSLGDDSSPDTINDVSVDSTGKLLSWTSPGDDGDDGEATLYLIRYLDEQQVSDLLGLPSLNGVSMSEIEQVVVDNFDDATQVSEFIEPQDAGNTEFVSIPRIDYTGMTSYFFAVATNDEVGNTSDVSNVVELNTPLIQADITSSNPASCIGDALAVGEIGGVEDEDDDDEEDINDLIIGDPCTGRVYVFFGGVRLAQLGVNIDVSQADLTIIGDPAEGFGTSVSRFGDFTESINFDELAIGAPDANDGRGRVYVIFGDDELPSVIDFTAGDEPDIIIEGESPGDNFGLVIIDESSDSDDLLVGAPNALSATGKAYNFNGSDLSESDINIASDANEIFIGENPGDRFGSVLTSVEDVDNASTDEFAISAPGAGKVYVFFDDNGRDLAVDQDDVVVITGPVADRFGEAIGGGFNVNGELEDLIDFDGDEDEMVDLDEECDFVIGAPGTNGERGAVYFYNDEDLESANEDGTILMPAATLNGVNPGDQFGASVDILADFNPFIEVEDQEEANVLDGDDSNGDIIVGAPGANGGAGSVYVFFGSEDYSGTFNSNNADITIDGSSPGDAFGSIVLDALDINDDDFNDFIVGGNGFISTEY